jgi:glycosyltransferase involved in cell wall biosynthesis
VAGDGPLADRVRGEGVRALGFREDTARLLAASDLFVLPSAREGLSLALLEAMGHGLPCVVSDDPGNREAVGDAGVVHPVGDAPALAEALAALAADPDKRARLGAAARARVQERFTLERFLGDMRGVLDDVLS